MADEHDDFVEVESLHLDLENPRSPSAGFASEQEVLEFLIESADVGELVQSIGTSGWLDYEPLVVLRSQNIVLEGNRRLAALRLLANPELSSRLGVPHPENLNANAVPSTIRVRYVESRESAREYIGFKHINGPFKWNALAKARYAAQWVENEPDIRLVSKKLGDSHNTVVRLVNGWIVLKQSVSLGHDPTRLGKTFSFSHLYTALARPNVRRYLGLPEDLLTDVLPANPIPPDRHRNLEFLLSWLYGEPGKAPVLRSQNPDLNRIVEVLGNAIATEKLEATRDLELAYDQAEDKSAKFSSLLYGIIKQAEETLGLSGGYDASAELFEAAGNLRETVAQLYRGMKAKRDEAEEARFSDAH